MDLLLVGSLKLGGLGIFIAELSSIMSRYFDNVYIYSLHTPDPTLTQYVHMKNGNIYVVTRYKRLIPLLTKKCNDFVLHLNYSSLLPIVGAKLRSPYSENFLVLTEHGFPQPWYEEKILKLGYSLELSCLKWLVPNLVKKIITISLYARKLIVDYINRPDVRVVYNGVNHSLFKPMLSEKVKQLQSLDDSSMNILFIGRLTKYKGAHIVFEAFKEVLRHQKDARLLIRGNGPLLRYIRKSMLQNDLKDKIKIFGPFRYVELPYLYNSADIFVHASVNEMFGLTLVEAMACGLPIVASPTGAIPEIAGDAPLYFKPFDVKDLADKLLTLLYDSNLRRKLSEKAVKRSSCFNWENTAAQYLKIYYEQ